LINKRAKMKCRSEIILKKTKNLEARKSGQEKNRREASSVVLRAVSGREDLKGQLHGRYEYRKHVEEDLEEILSTLNGIKRRRRCQKLGAHIQRNGRSSTRRLYSNREVAGREERGAVREN